MLKIDTEKIKERLFSDSNVRGKIARDFGIIDSTQTKEQFFTALTTALGQVAIECPLDQNIDNKIVFKAAVWALGSNSRRWSTFLANEEKLGGLLVDYDPHRVCDSCQNVPDFLSKVASCLPGQTASRDAEGIKAWALLLNDGFSYYPLIQKVGLIFRKLSSSLLGKALMDSELMLCLVGYLCNPPTTWTGGQYFDGLNPLDAVRRRSNLLPRMKYTLGSEFFRNLGWNGFKPDRHVKRLFDRFFPHIKTEHQSRTGELQKMIGKSNKDLSDYLLYSLIGINVSPKNMQLSQVDQLVWLLGSYAEKKGKESSQSYTSFFN